MSPFDGFTVEDSTQYSTHTEEIANNMAMIFADQVKKGLIPWYNVPKALRPIVQTLLDRGE